MGNQERLTGGVGYIGKQTTKIRGKKEKNLFDKRQQRLFASGICSMN
jgi:hypothetical protein